VDVGGSEGVVVDAKSDGSRHTGALAIITSVFFMWGFLTCLNDILVPHLKSVFTLGYAEGALVQLAFFSAYFLMALPAGRLVASIGYKRGIVLGLATAGVGGLLFYPAATVPSYALFLGALFVLATGITLLQVTANPYVTALGPRATASSRLNLTQAFNSLGTTLAPYFGGHLILARAEHASALEEARAVRLPYLGIAATLFALAIGLAVVRLPRIASVEDGAKAGSLRQALAARKLRLAALGIFLYVGAEVSIGTFLVSFFELPSVAGLSGADAAKYVSVYWAGAMVGRFAGSAALRRLDPARVLSLCALAACVLVLATVVLQGHAAMWAILSVGLFNSIMFPTIFAIGVDGLGRLTSQASSILVMAIVGGAVVPVVFGWIADRVGVQKAFVLPALAYVYVAWLGHRERSSSASPA